MLLRKSRLSCIKLSLPYSYLTSMPSVLFNSKKETNRFMESLSDLTFLLNFLYRLRRYISKLPGKTNDFINTSRSRHVFIILGFSSLPIFLYVLYFSIKVMIISPHKVLSNVTRIPLIKTNFILMTCMEPASIFIFSFYSAKA